MAVQAQYPSNILLLNRTCQETLDYPVQPQPGEFLDQSHMFFNNGESTNPRKRGRENSASSAELVKAQMEPFYNFQQSHSPDILDLSQLQTQQQSCVVVSTGLRLAYADQQNQQKHQILSHRSQQTLLSPLSDNFASQIKQERQEIVQLLQAHAAELRRTLAENRRRHYHDLLYAAEEAVAKTLREKETELENARRQKGELDARAAYLTAEVQKWQAKARAHETTAESLQAQLQRAILGFGPIKAHDGLYGAGSRGGRPDDAESSYVDPNRVQMTGPSCNECKKWVANIVIFPCRHLSVCKGCDQLVQACPLCLCLRSFSVEVKLS